MFVGRSRELHVLDRELSRSTPSLVVVDFVGQTVSVIARQTGEVREAQIFVGVLGASNFTHAKGV